MLFLLYLCIGAHFLRLRPRFREVSETFSHFVFLMNDTDIFIVGDDAAFVPRGPHFGSVLTWSLKSISSVFASHEIRSLSVSDPPRLYPLVSREVPCPDIEISKIYNFSRPFQFQLKSSILSQDWGFFPQRGSFPLYAPLDPPPRYTFPPEIFFFEVDGPRLFSTSSLWSLKSGDSQLPRLFLPLKQVPLSVLYLESELSFFRPLLRSVGFSIITLSILPPIDSLWLRWAVKSGSPSCDCLPL